MSNKLISSYYVSCLIFAPSKIFNNAIKTLLAKITIDNVKLIIVLNRPNIQ